MTTSGCHSMRSLFSPGVRTYAGPRSHSEPDYAFLDRSARPTCEQVRETLDAWFGRVPEYARSSIRARFANSDPGHHLGGLLELYLHESFFRLDYTIDLDIGHEDPDHRRPDFLLSKADTSFYVEASAVLGADVLGDRSNRPLAAAVYDAINLIEAPGFFLAVDIEELGDAQPGRSQIVEPTQRWLAGLDPDVVLAGRSDRGGPPEHSLRFNGWEIRLTAIPVSVEYRGASDHQVLGSHSEGAAVIDDATPLQSKLKKKGSRYGQLDQPYLVALLCAGDFVEDHDIADALLGTTAVRYYPRTQRTEIVRQLDGFWHSHKGPQNTRVSAVMTVPRLNWSSIIITEPTIWLNPWSAHPLKAPLPWRTHTITTDGHFTTTEATCSAADVLALPASWPA